MTNTPDPSPRAHVPSVVVIGNGSSVLDQRMGSQVDAFDVIVRLNNFQIDGYERHVGSRTTLWARNNTSEIAARDPRVFQNVLICVPRWVLDRSSVPAWVRWRRRWDNIPLARLRRAYPSAEVVAATTLARLEASLAIRDHRRHWPSTGLIALAHLVERYRHVCIHGFDFFASVAGAPRHYFNAQEAMRRSHPHQVKAERQYVERLIAQGGVWRLTDAVRRG